MVSNFSGPRHQNRHFAEIKCYKSHTRIIIKNIIIMFSKLSILHAYGNFTSREISEKQDYQNFMCTTTVTNSDTVLACSLLMIKSFMI